MSGSVCQQCASPMSPLGFCTDSPCPYARAVQRIPLVALEDWPREALWRSYGWLLHPSCWTPDTLSALPDVNTLPVHERQRLHALLVAWIGDHQRTRIAPEAEGRGERLQGQLALGYPVDVEDLARALQQCLTDGVWWDGAAPSRLHGRLSLAGGARSA